MNHKISILVVTTALLVPGMSHAAGGNFDRDRNIPVAGRIPQGYAPLGLKLGQFNVAPGVDVVAENNDNIYYSTAGKTSDAVISVAPSATFSSDWGRHLLQASLRANYRDYAKYTSENTLSLEAAVGGRLDIHGNDYLYGNASVSQNYEGRNNPASSAAAATPVKYYGNAVNAGFVTEFNRLRFNVSAGYLKLDYVDVRAKSLIVNPSGFIDQDKRDYSKTNLNGRVDYALSPATSIYATAVTNQRTYKDASINRDSHGYDIGVGASFDLSNLITGEAQVGYLEQKYKNAANKKAHGLSLMAEVTYYPTQMTSINLHTHSGVEETPQFGASGYTSTVTSLKVDHELLRNAIITASFAKAKDVYHGVVRNDDRTTVNLGGQYLVSRNVALSAGYTYSENKSTGATAIPSFKDNAFRFGLGLRY